MILSLLGLFSKIKWDRAGSRRQEEEGQLGSVAPISTLSQKGYGTSINTLLGLSFPGIQAKSSSQAGA